MAAVVRLQKLSDSQTNGVELERESGKREQCSKPA